MIRIIAHLMKLAICIIKHSSVHSLSISCSSFSFITFSFPTSLRIAQHPPVPLLSSSVWALLVSWNNQRQPEGMYFSYLSDRYFGGLRGMW